MVDTSERDQNMPDDRAGRVVAKGPGGEVVAAGRGLLRVRLTSGEWLRFADGRIGWWLNKRKALLALSYGQPELIVSSRAESVRRARASQ
jgi:hypothetical protein